MIAYLFSTSSVYAKASAKLLVGAIANSKYLQGQIKESNSALDIAIAGHGFIPLQSHDGQILYSRRGALGMDQDGDLEHVPSSLKVLTSDTDGKLQKISLTDFATRPAVKDKDQTAKLTAMGFGDDGALRALYSDGQNLKIATIKLAAIENSRSLTERDPESFLLEAGASAGEIQYLPPKEYPVGEIYGHHLESKP
jgi:flagellar hook protein FlgE